MPDRRSPVERQVAEVLASHVLKTSMGDGCFCTCGEFSVGRGVGASEAQAAHQAEALLDAGLLDVRRGAAEREIDPDSPGDCQNCYAGDGVCVGCPAAPEPSTARAPCPRCEGERRGRSRPDRCLRCGGVAHQKSGLACSAEPHNHPLTSEGSDA